MWILNRYDDKVFVAYEVEYYPGYISKAMSCNMHGYFFVNLGFLSHGLKIVIRSLIEVLIFVMQLISDLEVYSSYKCLYVLWDRD